MNKVLVLCQCKKGVSSDFSGNVEDIVIPNIESIVQQ